MKYNPTSFRRQTISKNGRIFLVLQGNNTSVFNRPKAQTTNIIPDNRKNCVNNTIVVLTTKNVPAQLVEVIPHRRFEFRTGVSAYQRTRRLRHLSIITQSRSSRDSAQNATNAASPGGGSPGDDSGGSEPPQGDPDLPSRPLIGGYPLVFPPQPGRILPSWRLRCPGLMSHTLFRGWPR
jgi:hypothetical protein